MEHVRNSFLLQLSLSFPWLYSLWFNRFFQSGQFLLDFRSSLFLPFFLFLGASRMCSLLSFGMINRRRKTVHNRTYGETKSIRNILLALLSASFSGDSTKNLSHIYHGEKLWVFSLAHNFISVSFSLWYVMENKQNRTCFTTRTKSPNTEW